MNSFIRVGINSPLLFYSFKLTLSNGKLLITPNHVYAGNNKIDLTKDTIYTHPSAIQCNASSEIESLKTSVSNGKSLIASAITDKGISTASDATFQTMANNINSLEIQTDAIKQLTSGWTYRATSREIINNYYPDYTGTARLTSTNGIDRSLIPRKANRSGNLCGLYYDYTDYIQIKAPDCSLNANGTITISGYDAVYALSRISSVSSDRSWNITPLEYSVEDSTLRFLVPSHSWRYDGNTYTLTCNNLIITAKCGITAQAIPPSSSIIFDNESLHFVYTSSGI